jgi:hypothetical protein
VASRHACNPPTAATSTTGNHTTPPLAPGRPTSTTLTPTVGVTTAPNTRQAGQSTKTTTAPSPGPAPAGTPGPTNQIPSPNPHPIAHPATPTNPHPSEHETTRSGLRPDNTRGAVARKPWEVVGRMTWPALRAARLQSPQSTDCGDACSVSAPATRLAGNRSWWSADAIEL